MWRFVSVATPPEPVTLEQARRQCNLLSAETEFDDKLALLIAAGRRHVEKVCGLYFGSRAVVLTCDAFEDLCRLPVAPVTSIASIAYVDTAGAAQTVAGANYEMTTHDEDGIEPAVVAAYGVSWPATQAGSKITVTLTAGFAETPAPVHHAMLLWIGDAFASRENAAAGGWSTIDSLLCNYRRGV